MVSVNISVPWQLPMAFVDKQILTSGSCVRFDLIFCWILQCYALSIRNDASLHA